MRFLGGGEAGVAGDVIAQQVEELKAGGQGGFYVLGEDGLVGMMAEAAGAAEEEHGGGYMGGEDHRIVAGSAGHEADGISCTADGCLEEIGKVRVHEDGGLLGLNL